MKKLKKICSKSDIRPQLQYIKVTEDTMEVTDTFRYVSVKNRENIPAGFYHNKTGEVRTDIDFPDVSVITGGLKNDLVIRVNRKYLIEVLEALEKGDQFDQIDIKIDVERAGIKPILLENQNGYALLMPIGK